MEKIKTTKPVEYLIVDTTAFIQNAPLQEVAENIITCPEVVLEVTNKRQLRRLIALPYNLVVKEVFPENVKIVTEFSKKTGDYPSLSATDIKVMALTYQLEKEKVGNEHLRSEPIMQRPIITTKNVQDMTPDVTGFFLPRKSKCIVQTEYDSDNIDNKEFVGNNAECIDKIDEQLTTKFEPAMHKEDEDLQNSKNVLVSLEESSEDCGSDSEDDSDWITPSNVNLAKKQINSDIMEEKQVSVACMTTDFSMQNVLKQMNLNVSALNGRIIKQLRTYILRCYSCFKTTSIMTKQFCPKCGNDTLKKVAVSLDENGKMQVHINPRKPLTAKGKKFSVPRIKGGKHPNNPILVEDQPMPDNRPSRLARTKNNPLDDDYIAGFSPFVMRDVNSKSAQLCIRPNQGFKHRLRKNPNENCRKYK